MDIICITTSIIYTFNTRGKPFKPTSSSFKLLETMNIICNMEFIIVSVIYKSIWNLSYYFKQIQLIVQRPIASIYEKTQTIH